MGNVGGLRGGQKTELQGQGMVAGTSETAPLITVPKFRLPRRRMRGNTTPTGPSRVGVRSSLGYVTTLNLTIKNASLQSWPREILPEPGF